ncbi:hypothetical protein ABK040_007454 [Willaertia magna]
MLPNTEENLITNDNEINHVVLFDEFEASKENIIPLKQGRKATDLRKVFGYNRIEELRPLQPLTCISTSLSEQMIDDEDNGIILSPTKFKLKVPIPTKICFDNHNMKPKLLQERKQFEKRLKNLTNHLDPLSVWIEYISWIESNFPSLGKDSEYTTTLQSCTKFILTNTSLLERYKEDERYLKIWLKYSDQCKDPLDVFSFLDQKNIGLSHSDFYIQWATLLEDRGDLKAADNVLDQGLHRGAQPLKKLETFHTSVKARFMKSILNRTLQTKQQIQQNRLINETNSSVQQQREAFAKISKKIPPSSSTIRPTVSKPVTTTKPMKMKMNNPTIKKKLSNFTIFDDTTKNQEKTTTNTRTLPFQLPQELQITPNYLPTEIEQEKENNQSPDKWNNYTLPQSISNNNFISTVPPPSLPTTISTVPPQQRPTTSFSIFIDEEFQK